MIPKNKKNLFILLAVLVVAVFILLPHSAKADPGLIDFIAGKAIGFTVSIVNYIIAFIGGLLFTLAGWFVDWALYTNRIVAQTPVVKVGWGIARDLANLGFVIVILVISFATALRYEKYGMKQTLGKLIVIALLINFSLTIAGVFLDFAGVITDFFVSKASLSPDKFASALATAFAPQRLMEPKEAEGALFDVTSFGSDMLNFIGGLFFTVFFTIISVIAMFALGIMLFIRFVFLTILLILMPLAWLCYVLPATAKYCEKWWDNFTRWVIFAPVTSFFLYLAIMITSTGGDPNSPLAYLTGIVPGLEGGVNINETLGGNIKNPAATFGQMIAVIGLLIGGLIAANSLSIHGAAAFAGKGGLLTKMGQGLSKWAGRTGRAGASRITGSEPIRTATEKLSASKFAPARLLGRGINRLGARVEKTTGEYRKQAESMSAERLKNEILNSRGIRRNVLLEEAGKKKKIDEFLIQQMGLSNPDNLEKSEKQFKAQGLDFKNVTKALGYNPAMLRAKTQNETNEAAKNFYGEFKPEDFTKGQYGQLFRSKPVLGLSQENYDRLQKAVAHGISETSPGAIYKIMPNLKGEEINRSTLRIKSEIYKMVPEEYKERPLSERVQWIKDNPESKGGRAFNTINKAKAKRLYGEIRKETEETK